MSPQRIRRRPDEARSVILQAAEELLIAGGPQAVQMRAVAQRLGMTDAGIAHHFGTRDALLEALLRHGGRRIRQAVTTATDSWLNRGASVQALIDAVAAVYAEGYGGARHCAACRRAARRRRRHAHARRRRPAPAPASPQRTPRPPRSSTRLAVAALHQALATETAYGAAFRRSAGITDPDAGRSGPQLKWWCTTITTVLQIPDDGPGDRPTRPSANLHGRLMSRDRHQTTVR